MKPVTVNHFYVTPIPQEIRVGVFDRLSRNPLPYSEGLWPHNPLDLFERTSVDDAYARLRTDLETEVQDSIVPAYKHLDIHATRLRPNEIHTLCAAATMSLGRSANLASQGRVVVVRLFGPDSHPRYPRDLTIDIEDFLRGVQNGLFDHYRREYGFGA